MHAAYVTRPQWRHTIADAGNSQVYHQENPTEMIIGTTVSKILDGMLFSHHPRAFALSFVKKNAALARSLSLTRHPRPAPSCASSALSLLPAVWKLICTVLRELLTFLLVRNTSGAFTPLADARMHARPHKSVLSSLNYSISDYLITLQPHASMFLTFTPREGNASGVQSTSQSKLSAVWHVLK